MKKALRWLGDRVDWRMSMVGFTILLLMVVSLAWQDAPVQSVPMGPAMLEPEMPLSDSQIVQEAPTEELMQPTPTQTPLPPELLANYQQTTGVILFAGVVVLVVVAGVLNELIRERKSRL